MAWRQEQPSSIENVRISSNPDLGAGSNDSFGAEDLALKLRQQQEEALLGMGAPQELTVRVPSAEKSREGKLVFTIECELGGFAWTVTRREKDLAELHTALSTYMKFVPDPPRVERSWPWRGAEQVGAATKRLQDYLRELTVNGQWEWAENRVLQQFLQINPASDKRQARELLLRDIRSHPVKDVRSQMLQDINSGNARKQALKQQQALGRTAQGPDIAPGELASPASSVHQSTGARFSGSC